MGIYCLIAVKVNFFNLSHICMLIKAKGKLGKIVHYKKKINYIMILPKRTLTSQKYAVPFYNYLHILEAMQATELAFSTMNLICQVIYFC